MPRLRSTPILFALLLVGTLVVPASAHDGEHPDGGKKELSWPGNARADEVARALLADSEPAQDLAAQQTTACTDNVAGGYPCSNVDLLAFMPLADIGGGKGNDVWGWTDAATGKEYAIMGRSTGTAFVDITAPDAPRYLGNLPTVRFSSTWRDIKVYGDYAFVVSEARNHGMQVFDLTRLREVGTTPVTFTSDARYTGFGTAHNVFINEASGYAYAVGSNTCSGGLHIVDIRNPLRPTQAGCYAGDGYTHDVQCVNYSGPTAIWHGHELCFASNEDTLTVVDVTDKGAMRAIARVGYVGAAYTHQGWLTDDQRYFLIDDELDEGKGVNTRTYVFDVGDPANPLHKGTHVGSNPAIDHNQYVVGNHTFQANYRSGLRILRLDDLATASLSEVAYFDIYPGDDLPEFNGAWSVYPFFASGTVVVSGIEQGLFLLRPDLDPTTPGGNEAPVVALEAPGESESVGGAQAVTIAASDREDAIGTLAVDWRVEDGDWAPATYDAGTDRYTATWDTTTVGDGEHSVTVRATDASGAAATDAHDVVVDNVPDPEPTLHVGDLDGTSVAKGKSGRWEAQVTVTVHNSDELGAGGVSVIGSWSGALTAVASGTTASDGTVTFATGTLSAGPSVTFTVETLDGTAADPLANHDIDVTDSDGTRITVTPI